ncbi:MAG TPA: NfeD family protein [Methylophaga aminisulfidivorans]|uniref:NfeD family protein n=1 Tax=Methylophaga aminisulfidivorans TaxID=230105 RepID=A0A7C1W5S2_9GAMM|nr:NfeD family protein [Methylophaga aminisulfidivorans]
MPFVIDFWHWWILGVALVIIEMLLPTFFALWMGIASFITGLVLWVFPELSWQYQLLFFSVLSIISIFAWRQYYKEHPLTSDQPNLNRRGEQYIGRVVTLQTPIVDGVGKIKLDDSSWKVEGPDCNAGQKIRITDLHNVVFKVEIAD